MSGREWRGRLADWFNQYPREFSAAVVYAGLLGALALAAPDFYSAANLRDLTLGNLPVLVTAIGMTAIIVTRQIDISIGSQFAWCTVVAGMLAKSGLPLPAVFLSVILFGVGLGMINGGLVAFGGIPSIVVTLAMMIILRDALKWWTEGEWIQGLPANFQWLGWGQSAGQISILVLALALWSTFVWGLRNVMAGRAIYAVGADAEAARLAGLSPARVVFGVFSLTGGLVGLASFLNSIRFAELQSNAGMGLELKTIAAVVVGGTAVSGGRGTLIGSLLGVALLGTIGTALTFLGISPFWEKAIQGGIILAAVSSDLLMRRSNG